MLEITARDTLCGNGQLMRSQTECLFGHIRCHTIHLIKDTTGLDYGDPVLWVTLPLTHPSFSRLLGNRLIGKNSRPNLSATLHTSSDRDTCGFDLPTGNPARLKRLQTKLSEGNLTATIGFASHTPLHHFAKLYFLWC